MKTESIKGHILENPLHFHSYPGVTRGQGQSPLTSVRSEGSTSIRIRLEEEVTKKELLSLLETSTKKPSRVSDDSSSESGEENDC